MQIPWERSKWLVDVLNNGFFVPSNQEKKKKNKTNKQRVLCGGENSNLNVKLSNFNISSWV